MTKEEIVAELHRTRTAIATDTAGLQRELDYPAKFKAEVNKNPWLWLTVAVAVGWWLSGPKTKTRTVTKTVNEKGEKVKVPQGKKVKKKGKLALLIALIRFAFPYIRPALTSYASQLAAQVGRGGETLRRRPE